MAPRTKKKVKQALKDGYIVDGATLEYKTTLLVTAK